MAFKFIAFLALVAVASAGLLPAAHELESAGESDGHAQYSFSYDVQDANTGDVKSQHESRDGDVVQGQYSLNDADGYRRVVDYSSDAVSGFRATVRREPLTAEAAVVSAPAPVAVLPKVKLVKSQTVVAPIVHAQTATLARTYAAPALVHHAPAHTLIHAPAAVHLSSEHATHLVHAAPLLKTAPAAVITHHAPAVVHSSLVTPHFHYTY